MKFVHNLLFAIITNMNLFKVLFALLLSLVIINIFVCFYDRYPGWIDRSNSSTDAIWYPNSIVIHGTEGYGIHHVDQNGYLNEGKLIQSGYTLVVGSSHTQGKEIPNSMRYSDILNTILCKKLGYPSNKLCVYNVSQDGYYYPQIVKNFKSIITEFPNSNNLVIEIGSTNFTADELKNSFNQAEYKDENRGSNIIQRLSFVQSLRAKIKEYFPIFRLIKLNVEIFTKKHLKNIDIKRVETSFYSSLLDKSMKIMKSEYHGNLIIVYHPPVYITKNGMIISKSSSDEIFEKIAKNNNILFLNMSSLFIEHYNSNYSVPYGFFNTSMGKGHLNSKGHEIIAKALSLYVK